MPISIYTDVVSALETKDMVRLGGKYGATGQQMCVGLDVAGRNIIEALADRAQTMDGAEQVFRKVGEFNGSIVEKFENGIKLDEMDSVVLFGTGSLNHLVGSQFDSIVDSVKQEAEASHVAAANIVGLTSALVLDFLGRYKKKFGLKRDNLTEILRTQKDLTVEPLVLADTGTDTQEEVMENLGLKPSMIETAEGSQSMEPIGDTTTQNVVGAAGAAGREKTPTEMAMKVANEAAAMKKAASASRPKASKAKKTKKAAAKSAPCPAPRPKKKIVRSKRKRSKKWVIAMVPLILIAGGSLYAWQLFKTQTSSVGDVVTSVSKKLTAYRSPAPTSESEVPAATTAKTVASDPAKKIVDSEDASTRTTELPSDDTEQALASTEIASRSFDGPIAYASNSIRKPRLNAKLAKGKSSQVKKSRDRSGWLGAAGSLLADVMVDGHGNDEVTFAATQSVQSTSPKSKRNTERRSSLSRDDVTVADDDWMARSFLADVARKGSQESYWWDKRSAKPRRDHLKVGAWQVTKHPRNPGRTTYFTYQ